MSAKPDKAPLKLYIQPEEFLQETAHLSAAQVGAYIRVLAALWNGKWITNSEPFILRITGMTDEEYLSWPEVEKMLTTIEGCAESNGLTRLISEKLDLQRASRMRIGKVGRKKAVANAKKRTERRKSIPRSQLEDRIREFTIEWNKIPTYRRAVIARGKERTDLFRRRFMDSDWPWREAIAYLPLESDFQPNIHWMVRNSTNARRLLKGEFGPSATASQAALEVEEALSSPLLSDPRLFG